MVNQLNNSNLILFPTFKGEVLYYTRVNYNNNQKSLILLLAAPVGLFLATIVAQFFTNLFQPVASNHSLSWRVNTWF